MERRERVRELIEKYTRYYNEYDGEIEQTLDAIDEVYGPHIGPLQQSRIRELESTLRRVIAEASIFRDQWGPDESAAFAAAQRVLDGDQ